MCIRDRGLFIAGAIFAAAFDIYDMICLFFKKWTDMGYLLNDSCPRGPTKFWLIMTMHHMTSALTVIPMTRHLGDNLDYHLIAFSLLSAAGVCYGTGQYKFTLDITTRPGMVQVKLIALIQFVAIVLTRAYIWVTSGTRMFYVLGPLTATHPELNGAYFGGIFMSLFNLVMVLDATSQAVKWVMHPMPGMGEAAAAQKKKTG
eukprot:TRINITY_DN46927_c0_g1_i1.p1 TRINITY_DN46927_c0_g1~~TRINITY_DN46927_c0_g1_i1.p1  ORF type:complete len:202 (+),score=48.27 TRINITY_DN46927_c0_g1_i1:162-767(+)